MGGNKSKESNADDTCETLRARRLLASFMRRLQTRLEDCGVRSNAVSAYENLSRAVRDEELIEVPSASSCEMMTLRIGKHLR